MNPSRRAYLGLLLAALLAGCAGDAPHGANPPIVFVMRPARIVEADRDAVSVVTMTRPRGYFGVGRDDMSLDGVSPPPGLSAGVAGVSTAKLKLNDATVRSVPAVFNDERIVVRSWPLKENRLVFAEFHY